MKQYKITIDGRTYEVEIEDTRWRRVKVRVDGELFEIEVAPEPTEPPSAFSTRHSPTSAPPLAQATPTAGHSSFNGHHRLDAPLPGTVVNVAVQSGQRVEPGDELLTIEAMKMLNVIRSPRAGTIAEVLVGEGKHVNHGDTLVTFK